MASVQQLAVGHRFRDCTTVGQHIPAGPPFADFVAEISFSAACLVFLRATLVPAVPLAILAGEMEDVGRGILRWRHHSLLAFPN